MQIGCTTFLQAAAARRVDDISTRFAVLRAPPPAYRRPWPRVVRYDSVSAEWGSGRDCHCTADACRFGLAACWAAYALSGTAWAIGTHCCDVTGEAWTTCAGAIICPVAMGRLPPTGCATG